jgi:hypothetical protein
MKSAKKTNNKRKTDVIEILLYFPKQNGKIIDTISASEYPDRNILKDSNSTRWLISQLNHRIFSLLPRLFDYMFLNTPTKT